MRKKRERNSAERGRTCRSVKEVKCQRRRTPSRSSDRGRSQHQGRRLFKTVKQSKGLASKMRSKSPVRRLTAAAARVCQARSLSPGRRKPREQTGKRGRPAVKEQRSVSRARTRDGRARFRVTVISKKSSQELNIDQEMVQHSMERSELQRAESSERGEDRGQSRVPEELLYDAKSQGCSIRQIMNISLGVLIAYLSVPVVQNLLNSKQVMNTSFNPLKIVNTYGAFGSITRERTEVIIQGTYSEDPNDANAVWHEYEFKCKPGNVAWRPCFITPYHYRLDWLMWFAAFQTYEQNEWIIHLAGKLLANDNTALSLIALNPFKGKKRPRWIRGEHYKYKFSQLGGKHAAKGKWWIRKRIGPYFPPVNLRGLKQFFASRDWPHPHGH